MYDITLTDSEDNSIVLPIAPASISTKVNGKNATKELINEGDINILKSVGLTEISFSFILPAWQYPFAKTFRPQQEYLDFLEHCMSAKLPVKFTVFRGQNSRGTLTYNSILVAVESYTVSESAENGFDLEVSLSLKAYKPYSTKTYKPPVNNVVDNESNRETKSPSSTYIVKSGDTLWAIAKAAYGNGNQWKKIYEANKQVIENAAKAHGKSSSSNGHWIYPGTKLTIPDTTKIGTVNSTTSTAKASSDGKTTTGVKSTTTTSDYFDNPLLRGNHKVTAIIAPSSSWKLNAYSKNVAFGKDTSFQCYYTKVGIFTTMTVKVFTGQTLVGTHTRKAGKTVTEEGIGYKIKISTLGLYDVNISLTNVVNDLRLVITMEK